MLAMVLMLAGADEFRQGAVDGVDLATGELRLLVVQKGADDSGKVVALKLTPGTKVVRRTLKRGELEPAKREEIARGQHVHVLRRDGAVVEIRLPAKKR